MITVNCSQCKAKLEMDDAFAGGVCRCHYCGTIQTVPTKAKLKQAAATAAAPTRTASSGAKAPDGLDALANVVATSESARAVQGQTRHAAAPAAIDYGQAPRQKTLRTALTIAVALILLLLGVMVSMFVSRTVVITTATPVPGSTSATGGTSVTGGTTVAGGGGVGEVEVEVPKSPHFCGIDLERVPSVVYVLDRGQATAELFDTLKEATYRSLETLKPSQKFQIIFWDNGGEVEAYPSETLAEASPQEIEAAREQFADVIAGGRAKADAAVRRAAASKPAAIVLVTGKAFDLDEELAGKVQSAVKGTTTKVHTVALRSDDGNTVLKNIAHQTRAEFRVITAQELRRYSY